MNTQTTTKNWLRELNRLNNIKLAFVRGCYCIYDYYLVRNILFILAGILLIVNYYTIEIWYASIPVFFRTMRDDFIVHVIPIASIVILILCVFLASSPFGIRKFKNKMIYSGFTNKLGEPPTLTRVPIYPIRNVTYLYVFYSPGLSLEDWDKNRDKAEQALDIFITDLRRGKNMSTIIAEGVSYVFNDSMDFIKWDEKYLYHSDFVLSLGICLTGIYTVNMNETPHALIAGSTGSGKTVMLKCLMYQAIRKSAKVYLVDFKGGVDFSRDWKSMLTMATNESQLNEVLDNVLNTLNQRKVLFDNLDIENIKEYNKKSPRPLERIVIFFDEVAECFDKSGLSTNDKKRIAELEHKVATIARLGRAFGIHLILGLQRPDANALTGQIKSNIDLRLCGRCDDTLSMIVLDKTDAAREIRKTELGRFMTSDGTLVQGFYFSDNDLK